MKTFTVFFFIMFTSLLGFAGPGEQVAKPYGSTSAVFGYYEYLPKDYNSTDKLPVLIFLHGLGEKGNGTTELSKVLSVGPPKEINNGRDFPFIVISPQRFNGWWHETTIDLVVDFVVKNYKVDKDRIYLTGLSSGGHGVWAYAAHFPEKVAAAVPIAGTGVNQDYCEIAKVPIWAFHGDADKTVYPSNSTTPINEMKKCPDVQEAKLTIYPGVGHNSWSRTYSGSAGHDIYSWMLSYSKDGKSSSPTVNQTPIVDAGDDISLKLPENSTTIKCTANDPDGNISSYSWDKVSGPSASLSQTNSSTLKVSSLSEGEYTFKSTVTDDKGAVASDEVKVSVETTASSSSGDCGCDHVVTSDMRTVSPSTLGEVKPGDVICLEAGVRDYISFKNIQGTKSSPITVKNCGGKVRFENETRRGIISFSECKFFRFTGSGVSGVKYGMKVVKGGIDTAIRYGGGCTDFEIDHVEVADAGFAGIMIKSDPMCQYPQYQRQNFTMENVLVHDNYIHDVYGEGLYIGHYAYNGLETSECGTIYPHDINNLKVYNNITKNTGADGIQVACNPIGCEIYGNLIEDYGFDPFAPYQSNGLIVGQQSKVYNNVIKNGKGDGAGMQVFGGGGHVIFNNLIINSPHAGIFCDERANKIDGPYRFYNNTIINSGAGGILLYGEKVPHNYVKNNIIVDSQGKYIVTLNSQVKLDESNNYTTKNVTDVKFADPSSGNYHLKSTSPCINTGTDVSAYGVKFDMDNVPRPYGNKFDMGAFEAKVNTSPDPNPPTAENGLNYEYYEGEWNYLPDFGKLSSKKQGSVANFRLNPRNRDNKFGFVFTGYIKIKKSGTYTFYSSSDDGSRLFIDGKRVVDNDGTHAERERSGQISLSEGMHAIKVTYFEKKGNEVLKVKYRGPNVSKQPIPNAVLFTSNSTSNPPTTPPSTEGYRILVNFNQYEDQPSPWNNVGSHPHNIEPLRNMYTDKSKETTVDIDFVNDWGGVNLAGMTTGNNSGVFPDNVMKSAYVISGNTTQQFKIKELNPSLTYRLVFFGSRNGSGDRTTIYKAGGKSVSLNASYNKKTVEIDGLKPNSANEILVEVKKSSSASYGYLNAMVVVGYDPNARTETTLTKGIGEQEAIVNGLGSDQYAAVEVFPNPVKDQLFVTIPESATVSHYQFTLLSNTDIISTWKVQQNGSSIHELNILKLGLRSGLYYLRIESDQKIIKTVKLLVN